MTRLVFALAFLCPAFLRAQEIRNRPAPEKLGTVSFPTSCNPETQREFNISVALLHSFEYGAAEKSFRSVAGQDPRCAIAHWGIAMTYFHQLWEPHLSQDGILAGQREIELAEKLPEASSRERGFIHALSLVYKDASTAPYSTRASNYETAMRQLAAAYPNDVEARVFYALALISNASPSDKEHRKQKQALSLLELLFRQYPDHPGVAHYIIHACDNQELASRGLVAARAYARIAPSAPHALHMPSHIFTRLGLWDESIASNLASIRAAQRQGESGQELHAMDYLVYAYLQSGRDAKAAETIEQLRTMRNLDMSEFTIGYAVTAMPVRYVVERGRWSDAEKIANPPASAEPQVVAIAVWARGLGFARANHPRQADEESKSLRQIEDRLRASGDDYWATQVDIMRREVVAWTAEARKKFNRADAIMRTAADDEDGIEKLPVTPGPIIPAREQLGDLLLEQGNRAAASKAFKTALANTPGRLGALRGAAQAAR